MRYGVRVSVTWRIVSELLRRHHAGCGLRLLETHPGSGTYDCLTFGYSKGDTPFEQHLCDFHMASQHLHVWTPFREPRARLEDFRWPDGNDYVLPYLAAEDPKQVVDQIEALLGLPVATAPVPPTRPATLVVRVIAAVMERHALSRSELEARCCWHDSSGMEGSYVESWISQFPDLKERIDSLPATVSWRVVARVAGRLWRLNPVGQAGAVLLDLGTGKALAGDESMSLWDVYRQNGRRLAPLVDWIEQRLNAA